MVMFAITRIPHLLPPSFSAAYALMFCAGVYFPGRVAWWLPLGTMLVTDIALDIYYLQQGWNVFDIPVLRYQLINYGSYACLIWFGRRFNPRVSFLGLLGGGILGAIAFYLITNTASWLFNPFRNPEYTRSWLGWLRALTLGTAGWPETWQFFRNTFLSGGLFTGLIVGAMKLTAPAESAQEKEAPQTPDEEEKPTGEEAAGHANS
jgi:hypothetical protein